MYSLPAWEMKRERTRSKHRNFDKGEWNSSLDSKASTAVGRALLGVLNCFDEAQIRMADSSRSPFDSSLGHFLGAGH
jgi:hypothetical protein